MSYDKARAGEFLQHMTSIMNGGALALMCSIGHKTGLFDTMSSFDSPKTSAQIAEAANLEERYVREWLAAMTVGKIVDHEPSEGTYRLPAEHAGLLTRAAGPLNLTTYCQYVALLGQVEDEVVDAFRNGGGVPYDRYPQFQALMAESSGARYERTLLAQIVPALGPIGDALTAGIDAADIGCGSGRAVTILAGAFPNSRFVGYDMSEGGIANANASAPANATFILRDAAKLGETERFDLITSFDAIHDQAHPDTVLAGIHAALRPGGTYLCVEPMASSCVHENAALPMAPMMYTVSTMHCMTVSLAYGGEGLGAAWGEQLARERLAKAGFGSVDTIRVKDDRSNTYYVASKA